MSENPYKSPQTDVSREAGLNDDGAPSPEKKKRLRWRLIPTVLLWLYGGIMVASSILFLCVELSIRSHDWLETILLIAFSATGLLGGICYCLGGRLIWRRRWLVATLAVGFGGACQAAAYALAEFFSFVIRA